MHTPNSNTWEVEAMKRKVQDLTTYQDEDYHKIHEMRQKERREEKGEEKEKEHYEVILCLSQAGGIRILKTCTGSECLQLLMITT